MHVPGGAEGEHAPDVSVGVQALLEEGVQELGVQADQGRWLGLMAEQTSQHRVQVGCVGVGQVPA